MSTFPLNLTLKLHAYIWMNLRVCINICKNNKNCRFTMFFSIALSNEQPWFKRCWAPAIRHEWTDYNTNSAIFDSKRWTQLKPASQNDLFRIFPSINFANLQPDLWQPGGDHKQRCHVYFFTWLPIVQKVKVSSWQCRSIKQIFQ